MFKTHNITVGYGTAQPVLNDVSVDIPTGKFTAIIGTNGCGKSTLLRSLVRLNPLRAGSITLGSRQIGDFSSREFARTVALLPQHPIAPDGVSVRELVGRGRYPHQGFFGRKTAKDRSIVEAALEATHVAEFADRAVSSLSGGQRQRVWIAMVLAQDTPIVLLDEPTTYLDMAHQIEILDLMARLGLERELTIVAVLHELNMAARCADHIIAMKDGAVQAWGSPAEVLTESRCREIFGLDAVVLQDPAVGTPVVVGRRRT